MGIMRGGRYVRGVGERWVTEHVHAKKKERMRETCWRERGGGRGTEREREWEREG